MIYKDNYRPPLDGLRAIAVLSVLYTHYWQPDSPLGHLGVRLFFVLSGFLITGILLDARKRVTEKGIRLTYWNFMARRALRLFPAYYTVILLLLMANFYDIQTVASWHLLHASNILFSIKNDHVPWVTAHHWSLSVEEQFYLLWPLLILTIPERWLWSTMVGTIAAGITFRYVAVTLSELQLFHYYFPLASLDALGGGSLLALYVKRGGNTTYLELFGILCGAITFVIFAFPAISMTIGSASHYVIVEAVAIPAMVSLVSFLARSRDSFLIRLFSISPVVSLGRISYGIYLYHHAVLAAIFYVSPLLGFGFVNYGPVRFAIGTILTIVVAYISWIVLEKPFLNIKHRFPISNERVS